MGFTDSLERAFLENAQQFALKLQWNLRDFIQKERGPVGQLKTPYSVTYRAGERSSDMPEELTLEQLSRYVG